MHRNKAYIKLVPKRGALHAVLCVFMACVLAIGLTPIVPFTQTNAEALTTGLMTDPTDPTDPTEPQTITFKFLLNGSEIDVQDDVYLEIYEIVSETDREQIELEYDDYWRATLDPAKTYVLSAVSYDEAGKPVYFEDSEFKLEEAIEGLQDGVFVINLRSSEEPAVELTRIDLSFSLSAGTVQDQREVVARIDGASTQVHFDNNNYLYYVELDPNETYELTAVYEDASGNNTYSYVDSEFTVEKALAGLGEYDRYYITLSLVEDRNEIEIAVGTADGEDPISNPEGKVDYFLYRNGSNQGKNEESYTGFEKDQAIKVACAITEPGYKVASIVASYSDGTVYASCENATELTFDFPSGLVFVRVAIARTATDHELHLKIEPAAEWEQTVPSGATANLPVMFTEVRVGDAVLNGSLINNLVLKWYWYNESKSRWEYISRSSKYAAYNYNNQFIYGEPDSSNNYYYNCTPSMPTSGPGVYQYKCEATWSLSAMNYETVTVETEPFNVTFEAQQQAIVKSKISTAIKDDSGNDCDGGTVRILVDGEEVDDTTEVPEGSIVTIAATPHDGWEVYNMSGASITRLDNGDGTFVMPGNDVTIVVMFSRLYTVSNGAPEECDITFCRELYFDEESARSPLDAAEGDSVTFKVDVQAPYSLLEDEYGCPAVTFVPAKKTPGLGMEQSTPDSGSRWYFRMPGCNVTIYPKLAMDIDDGDVVLENASVDYNGYAQKPVVKTVAGGALTGTEGEDYRVICKRNGVETQDFTTAGAIEVQVEGLSDKYTGDTKLSKTQTYTIKQADLSKAAVRLSSESFTYNKSVQKPTVSVSFGAAAISEDDYEVSIPNSVNANTYTVTLTGKNSVMGTATKQYKINKAPSSVSLTEGSAFTYTKGAVYNFNGKMSKSGSSKTPTYTYYSDSGARNKVSNHNNAGTYYVRATLDADANYDGATSNIVKFVINKAANTLAAKALGTSKKPVKCKVGKKVAAASVTNIGQGSIKVVNKSKNKVAKKMKVAYKSKKVNVTVPKGTKKGKYQVSIAITAAGDVNYNAGSKTINTYVKVT